MAPGISRRDFLKRASVASPLAATAMTMSSGRGDAAKRPNIVYILVDDLGYGDLSSYAATDMQTPHIDALMEAGLRIDQFYANSPICSPARAAMMTGCFADLVGVPGVIRTHAHDSFGYLKPDAPLLPEVLKQAGYDTALVGKWHLGLEAPNLPNLRGFDYFKGFLGDMMDDYYTHLRHGINYMRENDAVIEPEGHATDLFTDWSVDYIRERNSADNPFFLYLAYNAPHTPIQPPEDWLARVREREPDITETRAGIVALIEHMDAGIGKVVDALKETGAWDNTLFVFASDGGGHKPAGACNGELRGTKTNLYEGGIRVPMCAVWPGHIVPGTRNRACVATLMDLFPTACHAAGLRLEHEIDGVDLTPVLCGEADDVEDRTLIWVRRAGIPSYGLANYAARQGDWKLCQGPGPAVPFELFNLAEDPREENPVSLEHPMHRTLKEALIAHNIRSGRVPWQPPSEPV